LRYAHETKTADFAKSAVFVYKVACAYFVKVTVMPEISETVPLALTIK
jgi:hypothetical protein